MKELDGDVVKMDSDIYTKISRNLTVKGQTKSDPIGQHTK